MTETNPSPGNTPGLPDELETMLRKLVAQMDRNEKAMLLYTLDCAARDRSKGPRTRRIKNFFRWIEQHRAERVMQ